MTCDESELRNTYSDEAGTVREHIQDQAVLSVTVRKRGLWIASYVDSAFDAADTDQYGDKKFDKDEYEAFILLMIRDLREAAAEERE